MLDLLIVMGRGLTLALRGHRELVLENLALRQQLTAVKRTTKRPHLQTRDRLFWIALARIWRNAAGHRGSVASRLAPPPMDPPFETPIGRPSTSRSADPRPRPRDGGCEPVVGSAADSWRAAHTRCRRLRTLGVASAGTVPPSAFTDVEDVSHESPRFSRGDGFLHRPDAHWPGAVRPGLLSHHRRRIVHVNITDHPTATWAAQQVVDAFPDATAPSWLHRDRDRIYGEVFQRRLAGMGIAEVVSAPASPWQSPYVERLIGSIRTECLDHVIVINEAHLRRVLTTYSRYYHRSRTHLALKKDTPDHRPVSGTSTGPIVAIPEVGGLHHRYERHAA